APPVVRPARRGHGRLRRRRRGGAGASRAGRGRRGPRAPPAGARASRRQGGGGCHRRTGARPVPAVAGGGAGPAPDDRPARRGAPSRLREGTRHAPLRGEGAPAGGRAGREPGAGAPSVIAPPAARARCNPFAFPSNVDFAFALLVAVILGTSLLVYLALA